MIKSLSLKLMIFFLAIATVRISIKRDSYLCDIIKNGTLARCSLNQYKIKIYMETYQLFWLICVSMYMLVICYCFCPLADKNERNHCIYSKQRILLFIKILFWYSNPPPLIVFCILPCNKQT